MITDAELSALANEVATELSIVGAQVSVLHRGEISEGTAGTANLTTGQPMTTDTLVQIGSTTKVFTAALVMGLVEEGRIALDVPVVEQLPGFRLSDPAATATVTPRHLMSMSSGIDNGPYTDYGRGDDALARYVAAIADLPQVFQPGQGYGYSNASTCVSGRLVEHVTGLSWDDALRTRLLEPANLADSAVTAEDLMHRRFAVGHTPRGAERRLTPDRMVFSRSKGPSGGYFCSTASDLVRFASVFLHEGLSPDGTRVLNAAIVQAMHAREVVVPPTLLAEWWGLGPYGKVWDGVDVRGHSGTTRGGSSYLLWAVERDFAVATTVNTPGFGYPFAARMFAELFPSVAGIAVPEKVQPPAHVEVDASRLVGTYRMTGVTLIVRAAAESLTIEGTGDNPGVDSVIERSALIPLTATTFLPTNPAIDGRRGWALAFIGPEAARATHLVNGFFALRRVAP